MNVLKLKAKIIEKGYKTLEFQKATGIPNNTFYRALRNEAEFKESQIVKICELLDVDVTDIFFN